MKQPLLSRNLPRALRRVAGFTLVELILVIGAVGAATAVGIVAMTNTEESVTVSKFDRDVATVNAAIDAYRSNGGEFAKNSAGTVSTNGIAVLNKLKTVVTAAEAHKVAGLRGAVIDQRLAGVETREAGVRRAVWNNTQQRFIITTSPTSTSKGFSEFFLDETLANATPQEESRTVALELSKDSGWVWGFDNAGASAMTASTNAGGGYTESTPAGDPTGLTRLVPPNFSPTGNSFDFSAFAPNLPVSLVNPNPSNTADMFYALNGGAWVRWTGTPIQVSPNYTTTIAAFSAPLDPDKYEQSDVNSEIYKTTFFSGTSTGSFRNVVGPSGLYSNIKNGSTTDFFTFGDPATSSGWYNPNSLYIQGSSFSYKAPDEEFVVGTLSYYNSTTWSGSNATGVTLRMTLNLPLQSTTQVLDYYLTLNSTTNNGVSNDADADYVYIPSLSTNFSTSINGSQYALVLRFGEHTSAGFTTINSFHAWEGDTLTGYIYGRFVKVN